MPCEGYLMLFTYYFKYYCYDSFIYVLHTQFVRM